MISFLKEIGVFGFDYLKSAKEQLNIPYVAIGGINRENCDAIIAETPPLLGLIRDHEGIPELQEKMKPTMTKLTN